MNEIDNLKKLAANIKAKDEAEIAKVQIGSCLNCGEQICNTDAMNLLRENSSLRTQLETARRLVKWSRDYLNNEDVSTATWSNWDDEARKFLGDEG